MGRTGLGRGGRVPWFELKIVGTLSAALAVTGLAAVYIFHLGLSAAFGLILQPTIATALETAKDRTQDHIVALREQLKWRTERMAGEVRRRGPEARSSRQTEELLRALMEQDATASGAAERDGSAAEGTEGGAGGRLLPHLVEVSMVDWTGRRIRVRRPGEFPEQAWRFKTFRPRPPDAGGSGRSAVADALRAPAYCLLGACDRGEDRLRAAAHLLRVLGRSGEDDPQALADLDAAGLEARFATPWELFDGLQRLGEVLDRYKLLRMAGEEVRRRFLWVYMILLGTALVATLLVSLVFARRVSRRVNAVARATRAVAGGDLDVRIAAAGRDEVGELARAFNEMVTELRDSRERIAYLGRVSAWQGVARRLAHEIKNPLTPIQLAIQEVAEKYDGGDERYRKLVQTAREVIEEEVATLRRMTTEFSAFARLPRVEPVRTDLGEFLAECESAFGPTATEAGVSIRWTLPGPGLFVAIDRQMMRRVLDNLVKNAVEAFAARSAGEADPPRIDVWAGPLMERRQARIAVRDNGPGFAPEAREHLFEPYHTTKATGTGLGLAIVKKIVLEHGGEVTVEEAGRGAAFRIDLPLAAKEEGEGLEGAT